jgi:hypothetical protein
MNFFVDWKDEQTEKSPECQKLLKFDVVIFGIFC